MLAAILSLYVSKIRSYTLPLLGWKTPELKVRRSGALLLAALAIERVARIWWNQRKSPIGAEYTTPYVTATLQSGSLSSSQQRQVFVDTPVVRSRNIPHDHTHGVSANSRNAGSATAALVAQSLGLEPYYVQMSLSDVRKSRDGDRSFHWAKDLTVPPAEFHFDCTEQAAVLVDVDHHIDLENLLARHPGTYLISTFQPSSCALGEGEYTFRFLQNGKVFYRVSGGAEYEHEIWDYRGDTLVVEDVKYFWKTVVSYHIDRKYLDPHHCPLCSPKLGVLRCRHSSLPLS